MIPQKTAAAAGQKFGRLLHASATFCRIRSCCLPSAHAPRCAAPTTTTSPYDKQIQLAATAADAATRHIARAQLHKPPPSNWRALIAPTARVARADYNVSIVLEHHHSTPARPAEPLSPYTIRFGAETSQRVRPGNGPVPMATSGRKRHMCVSSRLVGFCRRTRHEPPRPALQVGQRPSIAARNGAAPTIRVGPVCSCDLLDGRWPRSSRLLHKHRRQEGSSLRI
jgi:hypothetical protein